MCIRDSLLCIAPRTSVRCLQRGYRVYCMVLSCVQDVMCVFWAVGLIAYGQGTGVADFGIIAIVAWLARAAAVVLLGSYVESMRMPHKQLLVAMRIPLGAVPRAHPKPLSPANTVRSVFSLSLLRRVGAARVRR